MWPSSNRLGHIPFTDVMRVRVPQAMPNQFQMKKIPLNVKCDCGATKKQHFKGEGQCMVNACTWFHPNIKYINRISKRAVV